MKLGHISANSSSMENATRFYGEVLGLKEIKSYDIDSNLSDAIFSVASDCRVILFGNAYFSVEVFIPADYPPVKSAFLHNCLEVINLDDLLKKCDSFGLEVNRVPKGEKTLLFLKDFDGNLFEIKEAANERKLS